MVECESARLREGVSVRLQARVCERAVSRDVRQRALIKNMMHTVEGCKYHSGGRVCRKGEECPYLHISPLSVTTQEAILRDEGGMDPISTFLEYLAHNCPELQKVELPVIASPFHAKV